MDKSSVVIEQANNIIEDYAAQNLTLTLRQLYYRFVANGWIPNKQREYQRLGSIINDARLAGLIDWEAIEDRGRSLNRRSAWNSPAEIINACAKQYALDLWQGQKFRVEVWVEKQALESVIDQAARYWNCPSFACKGYTSQSAMWRAAQRFQMYMEENQTPVIIHLGDHDPSGVDMTRDIQERLEIFGVSMIVDRIALNIDQVVQHDPPPNPAKLTDSRAKGYITQFGYDSWELDALEPATLHSLIVQTIETQYLDKRLYEQRKAQQEQERKSLRALAEQEADKNKP